MSDRTKALIRELIKRLPYTMAQELKAKIREPITTELVEKLLMQIMAEKKKRKGRENDHHD